MPNLQLLKKSQYFFTTTALMTDVHTCPDKRSETVTVHFCNQTNVAVAVRLAIVLWDYDAESYEAADPKQYVLYDVQIPANNILRYQKTLNQKDKIQVKAGTANAISITISIDESKPLAT